MRNLTLLAVLFLSACGAESENGEEDSVLYDAARTPLDKAEAVEDQILESSEKLDEAIEESGD